jgi:type II secretory pathway component GspD/PulD (secretin)
VLRALEQRGAVDLLSAPRVSTLSGRQAQLKRVEIRHVVTGLDAITNSVPAINGDAPQAPKPVTQRFELGPITDVVPYVQADGVTIRMTVIPRIKEFIGYDLESSAPLPIFRDRLIVASGSVWDGQTWS